LRGARHLTRAAADGRVVDQDAAGAAALQRAGQAVTARLDDLGALLVAAGAGDAHAAVGHLIAAQADGQVEVADRHAVAGAAAAAQAALEHRAELLHHAPGHRIITVASDPEAAGTLFHTESAARHHHEVRARRHAGRCAHGRGAETRHAYARVS